MLVISCELLAVDYLEQGEKESIALIANATADRNNLGLEDINDIRDTLCEVTDIYINNFFRKMVAHSHSIKGSSGGNGGKGGNGGNGGNAYHGTEATRGNLTTTPICEYTSSNGTNGTIGTKGLLGSGEKKVEPQAGGSRQKVNPEKMVTTEKMVNYYNNIITPITLI